MSIKLNKFNSIEEQYSWISNQIKKIVRLVSPNQIAIITRKHKNLKALRPYLIKQNLPISYEKGENVLDNPWILRLINIWKFVYLLSNNNFPETDEYLPKILSYDFWNISIIDIWELSITSKKSQKYEQSLWIKLMIESNKAYLKELAEFFLELKKLSNQEKFSKIIDYTLGNQEIKLPSGSNFKSPIKAKITQNLLNKTDFNPEYINFLSNLKVLIDRLKEHKGSENMSLEDFILFINLVEKNKLEIIDNSVFNSGIDSIQMLTAHKAKGLEFKNVFIIDCDEDTWFKNSIKNKIKLPNNLPFSPDKDEKDDKIRLFYVALTRAKENLYLTYSQTNSKNKQNFPINLLADKSWEEIKTEKFELPEVIENSLLVTSGIVNDQKSLLKTEIENYQLSPTHLTNFLDVVNGGPKYFLAQNLLRFPSGKSLQSIYGTVIHKTLRDFYLASIKENKILEEAFLISNFLELLSNEDLTKKEIQKLYKQGSDHLRIYYKNKLLKANLQSTLEKSFKNDGCILDKALLTGQIDRIENIENKLKIIDIKTGKPFSTWNSKSDEEKIKLWKYETQLDFYYILLKTSTSYGPKVLVDSLEIDFVAPSKSYTAINLIKKPDLEKIAKLETLIKIVYQKIINLDFSETANYENNYNGIQNFIEDLIAKKV